MCMVFISVRNCLLNREITHLSPAVICYTIPVIFELEMNVEHVCVSWLQISTAYCHHNSKWTHVGVMVTEVVPSVSPITEVVLILYSAQAKENLRQSRKDIICESWNVPLNMLKIKLFYGVENFSSYLWQLSISLLVAYTLPCPARPNSTGRLYFLSHSFCNICFYF